VFETNDEADSIDYDVEDSSSTAEPRSSSSTTDPESSDGMHEAMEPSAPVNPNLLTDVYQINVTGKSSCLV